MMMTIHTCRNCEASTTWDQSYDEICIGMKGNMWASGRWCSTESRGKSQSAMFSLCVTGLDVKALRSRRECNNEYEDLARHCCVFACLIVYWNQINVT